MTKPVDNAGSRTIHDFGEQWAFHSENTGYYASVELMQDMFGPLLSTKDLEGARCGDIGSGTGRIVRMLLDAGAVHVVAVEPSDGVEQLRENTADVADRVQIIHGGGEQLPPNSDLDLITSIGVLRFIPQPGPVASAAYRALKPGGRFVIWVYAMEGMRVYVSLVTALRSVTTRLPHAALSAVCEFLTAILDTYMWMCRWLPLPLRSYVRGTLARTTRDVRKVTIYDQLNPTYVRYHRRHEVEALLTSAGFTDVQLHHRRGYSWSAVGTKPV
jgi:SAM-dependent methyltransferase